MRYRDGIRPVAWRTAAFPLALILVFWLAGVAAAHSVEMTRSDPGAEVVLETSPERVTAWFNEEMQTQASTIRVFDASGQQVDLGDGGVDLDDPYHASMMVGLPPLPNGAYTVRWQVVLLDGDPTDGEFTFYVGEKFKVSNLSEPAAPEAPAAEPVTVRQGAGFPIAWAALGLGGLALGGGLAVMMVRSRSTRSG